MEELELGDGGVPAIFWLHCLDQPPQSFFSLELLLQGVRALIATLDLVVEMALQDYVRDIRHILQRALEVGQFIEWVFHVFLKRTLLVYAPRKELQVLLQVNHLAHSLLHRVLALLWERDAPQLDEFQLVLLLLEYRRLMRFFLHFQLLGLHQRRT